MPQTLAQRLSSGFSGAETQLTFQKNIQRGVALLENITIINICEQFVKFYYQTGSKSPKGKAANCWDKKTAIWFA
jgi:hypothetical protein